MKICKDCGLLKSESEFSRHPNTRDKLQPLCKLCVEKYKLSLGTREKIRMSEYEKKPKRIEYRKRYAQEHIKGSPEEVARKVITHGIRDGKIIRPEHCSVSGCFCGRVEGHHKDYTKPTEVVWLCRYHHRLEHSILKKQIITGVKEDL